MTTTPHLSNNLAKQRENTVIIKILQAHPQTDIKSVDGWGTTRLAPKSDGYKADRFYFSVLNACETVAARLEGKSFC